MQLTALIEDAERQLTVCNACRYCEGYCAVFPALERRVEVDRSLVMYLSNLCHDCRACYYACPYIEPHEFAIDLPRVLGEVRRQTYAEVVPRGVLRRILDGRVGSHVLITVVAFVVLLALVGASVGLPALGLRHVGLGSFYEVVPWLLMVVPGMALGLYILVALAIGAIRFLRDTGGGAHELFDLEALKTAGWEALTLRWLRGGDEGCHYPTQHVSGARKLLHFFVAGGFVAAFASTAVAALYQDVFGLLPPYDLLSVPVVLGAVGGVAMIVGSAGLLALKTRSDRKLTTDEQIEFDVAFLITIGLSSLTGMLVLVLRDTAYMPALLVIHLAVLTALYVTAPYGKFAHLVYRYAALVRNSIEARHERAGTVKSARAQ